jgi:hypothetical protein
LLKSFGSKKHGGSISRLVAGELSNVADKIDAIGGYSEPLVTVNQKGFFLEKQPCRNNALNDVPVDK